jgi:hypothetical protein
MGTSRIALWISKGFNRFKLFFGFSDKIFRCFGLVAIVPHFSLQHNSPKICNMPRLYTTLFFWWYFIVYYQTAIDKQGSLIPFSLMASHTKIFPRKLSLFDYFNTLWRSRLAIWFLLPSLGLFQSEISLVIHDAFVVWLSKFWESSFNRKQLFCLSVWLGAVFFVIAWYSSP